MNNPTRTHGPVFILGVHRSGTTWLSQSLAVRGRCAPYTVRHLLSALDAQPHTLQSSTQRLLGAGVTHRPGDGLPVLADSSEEYGYLLALRHGTSRTTRRSIATLRAAVDALQREHPEQPILLRNPWDYAATHKLAAWFPHARFVFVHRDPRETVGSAVEMFQEFWSSAHPYGDLMSPRYRRAWRSWWRRPLFQSVCARPTILARLIATGTALAHRAHLADAAHLPPHRQIHVRYTTLLDNTTAQVDQILDALDIPIDGPPLPATTRRARLDRPWMASIEARLLRHTARYLATRALDGSME